MRPVWLSRGTLAAGGAFALACVLAAAAAWRWAAIAPVTPDPVPGHPLELPPAVPADAPAPDVVLAAVERDPFHPERRRPGTRFRMPGDRREPVRVAARPPALPPTLQLTGTLVYPDGGGVALLRDQGQSRMVRVGERIGNFTLQRVARELAVFRAPNGTDVVVRVPRAGS